MRIITTMGNKTLILSKRVMDATKEKEWTHEGGVVAAVAAAHLLPVLESLPLTCASEGFLQCCSLLV